MVLGSPRKGRDLGRSCSHGYRVHVIPDSILIQRSDLLTRRPPLTLIFVQPWNARPPTSPRATFDPRGHTVNSLVCILILPRFGPIHHELYYWSSDAHKSLNWRLLQLQNFFYVNGNDRINTSHVAVHPDPRHICQPVRESKESAH